MSDRPTLLLLDLAPGGSGESFSKMSAAQLALETRQTATQEAFLFAGAGESLLLVQPILGLEPPGGRVGTLQLVDNRAGVPW